MYRFPLRHFAGPRTLRLAAILTVLAAFSSAPSNAADNTPHADSSTSSKLTLQMRRRLKTSPGSSRYHTVSHTVSWDAGRTAVIVCDMWDKHWCPDATKRVGEMAPRLNQFLVAARNRGALIIHCPSDTLKFYEGTPQRERARSAPPAEPVVPLKNWCALEPDIEGLLPIDDSDGGCDTPTPPDSYRAWSRQHPAILIEPQDAVTDSQEAWNLMRQHGITQVLITGVHTNMCVLGRPFGIRQLVRQGLNVALVRDLTDTMYNPGMAPHVSHFTGTDLVIRHIEKNWCPTVTSDQILGGAEFRFSEDKRPHAVIVCSEPEYHTETSLTTFADEELGKTFRVTMVYGSDADGNYFPGLEILNTADVALFSIRRRLLSPSQMQLVRDYLHSGKPLAAIRTSSHAFCLRNKPAPSGTADWPEFDAAVIGGSYTNHYGKGPVTTVQATMNHPLLKDIPIDSLRSYGSLYKSAPLQDGASQLLTGSIPNEAPEPIAWLYARPGGGTTFYTSMGHVDDFKQPAFRQLLRQSLQFLCRNEGQ